MGRSVLVCFRDGLGELLGDYNEKGGFFFYKRPGVKTPLRASGKERNNLNSTAGR